MASDPLRSKKEADSLLGSFLLQGWVMTDSICSQEGCCFPLMRSKDGSLSFCTHHDPLPSNGAHHNYKNALPEKPKPVAEKPSPVAERPTPIPERSTPVTEKPLLDDQDELRIRRERREQSSKASQLIGQKMLQRWALLNDHCPNSSCYAVPLVRNPETNQMYCVICENIILTEQEAQALENKKQKVPEKKTQETKPAVVEVAQTTTRPKRQKTTSASVVAKLSQKMDELAEKVEASQDPEELCSLFKSIKQCASAIQACVKADKAMQ